MDTDMLVRVLQIFTKVMIIFMILPIHEYAHAWVAHKLGDDTAAYSGRLTLNPLAHVDIIGAICLLVAGFGWAKPVPINPIKFKRYRAGIAITAAAGPASNIIAAFIAVIVYRVLIATPVFLNSISGLYEIYSDVDNYLLNPAMASTLALSADGTSAMFFILYILECFITINLGLAVFNLIPIPPLDGSKVLGYFTSAKFDRWLSQYQQIVSIAFIVIVVSGVLGRPLSFISGGILKFLWMITGFIPKLMGA